MRRMPVFVSLVLVACMAASCSSSTSTPGPTPSAPRTTSADATQPPLPSGTHELPIAEGATLAPARYTKADFTPRLSFQVGTGWRTGHDLAGFFDVQRHPDTLDAIAVQFA